MLENKSPWLAQLKRVRPITALDCDSKADIGIIGGGIAGLSTAYFILTMTKRTVILLEGDKIAHGATGHNGGQVVHYFEKPFSEMVEEFGLSQAANAQNSVLSAWDLLDEIRDNASLETPLYNITGYDGLSSQNQILEKLEDKYLMHQGGINIEDIVISDNQTWLAKIPKRYKGLYTVMPQSNILSFLETNDKKYIGMSSTRKAVMNTALFTEELAGFLLKKFEKRFTIYEMTHVDKLLVESEKVQLKTQKCTVTVEKAVLCTNGFEHFDIENTKGFVIDTKFHETVEGVIGYMTGYLEPRDKPPYVVSYLTDKEDQYGMMYYYLTRRPFITTKNQSQNLISIGGPVVPLSEKRSYHRDRHAFRETAKEDMDAFLKRTYKPFPKDTIKFQFHWHGLMGYTRNLMRLIGKEPCNKNLMYNLGCNGVGILPSIYGGKRIAQIIRGDSLKKSVFDPIDSRCLIK